MKKAVSIESELQKKTFLAGRTPHTTADEEAETFAELSKFGEGAIYVGAFSGTSCWERHPHGDEIVHVLEGNLEVTLYQHETETLNLQGGMLTVVPRGVWHRLHSDDGVKLMTVTALPTDMSIEDPRGTEDGSRA